MDLIIVESPTKAKTISKFLDKSFRVESSFGHIRDLPTSTMGVDIENDFTPKYVIPAKAKKTVTALKAAAAKATNIILASDEDREGEAIAWHLAEALKIDPKKTQRIVFHEITKPAIEEALKNPRTIDFNLVDAQQARRILDRLVGYELSPFLWKKVAKGLSAGRVQSVALRLIVEREREIQAFKADEYWSVEAELSPLKKAEEKFAAILSKVDNKTIDKLYIKDKEQADKILTDLNNADYQVLSLAKKTGKKNPPTPFTTSTLQQGANSWLGFSAKQTMMTAQKLYELGYITYMRTDSLNLATKFLSEAATYLKDTLGKEYTLKEPRTFKTKSKGAQEAHEAIRPTLASSTPEDLEDKLDPGQLKLYRLIWQRSLATQMPEAILETTVAEISAKTTPYIFKANGQVVRFDGYLRIYPEKTKDQDLPALSEGEILDLLSLNSIQHFTTPPARFSDATLVKELEKYGIGRPSTYAPTISTIIERNYVARDANKRLEPTPIAFVVIDLLKEHFAMIVDFNFTAEMENSFDAIAEGEKKWVPVIRDFYKPFHENLEAKYLEINKNNIMPEETSTEICDKCQSPMIIKTGRYGKFLACSNFPTCKNIKSLGGPKPGVEMSPEQEKKMDELKAKYVGEVCDKCGAPMAVKTGKFGPFLACSAYPKCKNIKNIGDDSDAKALTCPVCATGKIVKKFSRRGVFYACSEYPKCKNAYWAKPTGDVCPDCGALLVEDKKGAKCSNKECGYEK